MRRQRSTRPAFANTGVYSLVEQGDLPQRRTGKPYPKGPITREPATLWAGSHSDQAGVDGSRTHLGRLLNAPQQF